MTRQDHQLSDLNDTPGQSNNLRQVVLPVVTQSCRNNAAVSSYLRLCFPGVPGELPGSFLHLKRCSCPVGYRAADKTLSDTNPEITLLSQF